MDVTAQEAKVLRCIGPTSWGTATHWVAGHLGVEAPQARRILKRMHKRGLVEPVRASSGRVFWWRLTPVACATLSAIGAD